MNKLRVPLVAATLALLACSPGLSAQESTLPDDPLFATLFPPELIMQHRREIGLTDQQRDAISGLIRDLQGHVVQMQWDLVDQMQDLTETMGATRVDLDRALDQLDKVLDTEKDIKEAHLEMLVRIKNLLSAEQQAALTRLRGSSDGA